MKIYNNYSQYTYANNFSYAPKNFGATDNLNLKYIAENRLYIIPQRMQNIVLEKVKKGDISNISLRDLHLKTYAKILEANSLDEVKNEYPEFGQVLQANAVIKHKSPNIKKIMETMPLEDLSLFLIKERWGKLKTTDQIAKELGLKDRSAINWFMDKIQIPTFEKNYMMLLRATDEESNKEISNKVKAYNITHKEIRLEHNRRVAEESKPIQREISLRAWAKVPHIREALSEMATLYDKKILMAKFWEKYPEYAKEYALAKSIAAQELKNERKK